MTKSRFSLKPTLSKEPMFLQSEVKCIRFKSDKTVKPYVDFQTHEGTVIDLVDNAVDFVLAKLKYGIPENCQRVGLLKT
jgi:hypothetical protein